MLRMMEIVQIQELATKCEKKLTVAVITIRILNESTAISTFKELKVTTVTIAFNEFQRSSAVQLAISHVNVQRTKVNRSPTTLSIFQAYAGRPVSKIWSCWSMCQVGYQVRSNRIVLQLCLSRHACPNLSLAGALPRQEFNGFSCYELSIRC
ncbi:MAG: hypothetical protein EZS28_030629 [Streblomastix strix]|uniref:Uncharacterized protein n=1 Tax=Streblomastix strix TaxID=222440 RepID=A0A5J4UU97_9EUKA|nr:MAG: hypothetical protein EZS28_030629 [Streblomastix strix]